VQQDDRTPVRILCGLHIHETHPQILTLDKQIQVGSRVRIFQFFKAGSKRLFVSLRKSFVLGAQGSWQKSSDDNSDERPMRSHKPKYERSHTLRQAQANKAACFATAENRLPSLATADNDVQNS
jgi:hypothetical protein